MPLDTVGMSVSMFVSVVAAELLMAGIEEVDVVASVVSEPIVGIAVEVVEPPSLVLVAEAVVVCASAVVVAVVVCWPRTPVERRDNVRAVERRSNEGFSDCRDRPMLIDPCSFFFGSVCMQC